MIAKNLISITGTLLIGTISVFFGRPNLNATCKNATHLYYTRLGLCVAFDLTGCGMCGTSKLTTGCTGNKAFISTIGGSRYAIFNTSTCTAAHRILANSF